MFNTGFTSSIVRSRMKYKSTPIPPTRGTIRLSSRALNASTYAAESIFAESE